MESLTEVKRKMKILCLHGFRTNGSFLKWRIGKWDPFIFDSFDLDFPDGLFPAGGKSDIEGIFPPPYFEWFQFDKDFTEYTNLEECITYLCDYIMANGPFDGFLGFSQGANLSALLLGYQAQGKVLKDHPPIKFFISISGTKFRDPRICDVAYKDPIKVRSIHLIGDKDWLKLPSEELVSAFHDPLILRHPQGHVIPRLDEEATQKLRDWMEKIVHEHNSEGVKMMEIKAVTGSGLNLVEGEALRTACKLDQNEGSQKEIEKGGVDAIELDAIA
ncbi:hypothetical protein SAY87_020173 [Trapa incisa]|uniref:Serine hydrolase domain-containing protein n=1 Tax=Trapa incisa TaxID=236973 RepID=A0AAN7K761_9MYRT|nr:hypothetical protein SAY87_020173 [Trapa incisa]